jgi:hypothetical protein
MYKEIHARVIGGLNIFIQDIVEYIDIEGASSSGNRGIKYIYRIYCRIY